MSAPPEVVEAAASLLVLHQRRDVGSCLCGWNELGRSHPRHIAQVLGNAGLLRGRAAEPSRGAAG